MTLFKGERDLAKKLLDMLGKVAKSSKIVAKLAAMHMLWAHNLQSPTSTQSLRHRYGIDSVQKYKSHLSAVAEERHGNVHNVTFYGISLETFFRVLYREFSPQAPRSK